MAFKILNEKMADISADGKPIMYVNATYDTGDTLPTENIYQGSWALKLSDQSVVFFNGESWGSDG